MVHSTADNRGRKRKVRGAMKRKKVKRHTQKAFQRRGRRKRKHKEGVRRSTEKKKREGRQYIPSSSVEGGTCVSLSLAGACLGVSPSSSKSATKSMSSSDISPAVVPASLNHKSVHKTHSPLLLQSTITYVLASTHTHTHQGRQTVRGGKK